MKRDMEQRRGHLSMVAERLFGPEKAARWLRKENRALGGEVPLDLIETESGYRAVLDVLLRIEHGVFS